MMSFSNMAQCSNAAQMVFDRPQWKAKSDGLHVQFDTDCMFEFVEFFKKCPAVRFVAQAEPGKHCLFLH